MKQKWYESFEEIIGCLDSDELMMVSALVRMVDQDQLSVFGFDILVGGRPLQP